MRHFLSSLNLGSLLFVSSRSTITTAFVVPSALTSGAPIARPFLADTHTVFGLVHQSKRGLVTSPVDSTTAIGSTTTSSSTSTSWTTKKEYSKATQKRIQGLDPEKELLQWANKLGTTVPKLSKMLKQKLQTSEDRSSEKVEYMDWLVTETAETTDTTTGGAGGGASKKKKNRNKRNQPKKTNNQAKNNAPQQQQQQSSKQTFQTDKQFQDAPIHPNSKRALTQTMGFTSMTEIQAKTLQAASSGQDVLGRARTGTGKTVAFLLPAIERVLQQNNNQQQIVSILVVSPTRELATQIGDQAQKLTQFHKGFSVQVVYGGTNMKSDINRLQKRLPTILVATPGRLLDHLQSTTLQNRQGNQKSFGNDIMSQTSIVVLDETDRLLDMGFRREIQKILNYLPSRDNRQTLLFSATIPPELKTIMAQNMKPDFVEVDCINDGDAATHTNEQVRQGHIVVKSDRQVSSVVEIVRLALQQDQHAKIVVFFPTARLVNFYAEVFNQSKMLPSVLELHSKKTQSYRNRVSEEFRACNQGILFTSDVSARGVDYPNVSHVIQFGIPESREQYIHRLGRTGRGGTDGRGWLVLSEWESNFLSELKGVEIPVDAELEELLNAPMTAENDGLVKEACRQVRGGHKVLNASARGAYQAFLGYYKGQMKRIKMRESARLVEIANDFAVQSGLHEPPSLTPRMVGKMGLKGVPGLIVKAEETPRNNNNNSRRPGGNGGRGTKRQRQDQQSGSTEQFRRKKNGGGGKRK